MKGIMKYHEEGYGVYTLSSVVLPVTNGTTPTFVVISDNDPHALEACEWSGTI